MNADRPSTFRAINRVARSAQVRRQLEDAIGQGVYQPGDRLPSERELGELFGVSRVSVREALSALEAVGLVDVRHGRGCFVSSPDEEGYAEQFRSWLEAHRREVAELLDVRGALDQLAAEGAARNAEAQERHAIEDANRAFRRAAIDPATDPAALEQLDISFHESIAAASKNTLLAELLHDLNRHLSPSRKAVLAVERRRPQAAHEHNGIYEAVAAGRPDEARELARKHLVAARALLAELASESREDR